MKKTALKICALSIIGAVLSGCGRQNSAVGFYLDTVITISGSCDEKTLQEAVDLCGDYERLMSRTREGSDVWNVNHSGGKPVKVNPHTARVIALALEVGRKSGGALDITIAPAVELWNFKGDEAALPSGTDLEAAAEKIDQASLKLEGDTVTLPAGMEIDLGAVAKGYIGDRCAEYLAGKGVTGAVLNMGGNVIAMGSKPRGNPWTIGIQNPAKSTGEAMAAVEVRDRAVVTSGIYQRGFDLDGVRYHHILDPKTGWPVQNGMAGVTIITESSALGDALSTACFVLGAEKGRALAEEYGAEAIFVTVGGELICTQGTEEKLKPV